MGSMASQITSLTIVYSAVYSGADQRKHQSSASLAFVREFTGTGEFLAQAASNAENVAIWWRHHGLDAILKMKFLLHALVSEMGFERQLDVDLFAHYNPDTRPARTPTTPVIVNFTFYLAKIETLVREISISIHLFTMKLNLHTEIKTSIPKFQVLMMVVFEISPKICLTLTVHGHHISQTSLPFLAHAVLPLNDQSQEVTSYIW